MARPRPDRYVYLCGAGASVSAPANLPSVATFLSQLEDACSACPGLSPDLVSEALHGNTTNRAPRFEQVISILLEFDPDFRCLDYLSIEGGSDSPQPNALHFYLAARMQAGASVITTNFDVLIELAYFQMYGDMLPAVRSRFHKIHGSLQDVRDGRIVDEDRRQLKADIFSVAAGNPIDGAEGTLAGLGALIEGKHLVGFGYSFSDSYDVNPALMACRPKSATIIEYEAGATDLQERAELRDIPGFDRIAERWAENAVRLRYLGGDPIAMVPARLRPTAGPRGRPVPRIVPSYRQDQLSYLVARLLQVHDAFHKASPIFQSLIATAADEDLRARTTFYYVRTLPEWDDILGFEEQLMTGDGPEDIVSRSVIQVLDRRAFLGPGADFMRVYLRGKYILRDKLSDPDRRTLSRGRSYHCFANYLMNRGRPGWALKYAEASLGLRTQFGEPTDILFGEYACCMALALSGDMEALSVRLPAFLNYAELIGDQSAKICVAFVLGLQKLDAGDCSGATAEFELAKALYISGDQDAQIDPELELYLLESKVRAEGWTNDCRQLLADAARYVETHAYSYYRPVIDALGSLSRGEELPAKMDRLTAAHVARATGSQAVTA